MRGLLPEVCLISMTLIGFHSDIDWDERVISTFSIILMFFVRQFLPWCEQLETGVDFCYLKILLPAFQKNDSNFDILSFVLLYIVYAIVIVRKATNFRSNTSCFLTTVVRF